MIHVKVTKVEDILQGRGREEILQMMLPGQREEFEGRTVSDSWRESAAGDLLLAEMLSEIPGIGRNDLTWQRGTCGKPSIPEIEPWEFNISHEAGWVACVMAEKPVGVDLAKVDRIRDAVLQRYLEDWEREWIESAAEPELSFAMVWAAREAYGKWKGTGLERKMAGYRWDPGTGAVYEDGNKAGYMTFRNLEDITGEVTVLAVCSGDVLK